MRYPYTLSREEYDAVRLGIADTLAACPKAPRLPADAVALHRYPLSTRDVVVEAAIRGVSGSEKSFLAWARENGVQKTATGYVWTESEVDRLIDDFAEALQLSTDGLALKRMLDTAAARA